MTRALKALLILGLISMALCACGECEEHGRYVYFGDDRLRGILEIAAESNPNILAAAEKVKQAREDARNAAAALGPTLSVGGLARSEPDREVYNASLNLVQTLYAGGSVRANHRAARLALAATQAEAERTYQEVLNDVRLRYYDCLRTWAQAQVAADAVSLSEEHLHHAERLFRSGMVPRGDVLRVQVSLSQHQQELITAKGNFEVSWTALEHAVGTQLRLSDFQTVLHHEEIADLTPPSYVLSGDVSEAARTQRPELRAYQFYKERAEQLAKAAAGERAPRISLSGRLNADRDDSSSTDDRWYVQLEAQWMLYDGSASSSQVRKAKAAARELLYTLQSLSSQIMQEARQAEIQLRSAQECLALSKSQVATAQEDYRMALQRYDLGLGSNVDVLDSRQALVQSHTGYVDAVYDIAAAQSNLIFALGEDVAAATSRSEKPKASKEKPATTKSIKDKSKSGYDRGEGL